MSCSTKLLKSYIYTLCLAFFKAVPSYLPIVLVLVPNAHHRYASAAHIQAMLALEALSPHRACDPLDYAGDWLARANLAVAVLAWPLADRCWVLRTPSIIE